MSHARITIIESDTATQHLPAWQQTFRGLCWSDMPPQKASDLQKLNFALFRRGLYDPDLDVVTPEVAELEREEEAADKPKIITTQDGRKMRRRIGKKSPFVRAIFRKGPRPMTVEGMDRIARSNGRTEDGRPVGQELAAWVARGEGRAVWRIARIVDTGMGMTLSKLARGEKVWLKQGTSDRIRAAMATADEQLAQMKADDEESFALAAKVTLLIQQIRNQGITENYMCRLAGTHNNTIYRLKSGVRLQLKTLKQLHRGLTHALQQINHPPVAYAA